MATLNRNARQLSTGMGGNFEPVFPGYHLINLKEHEFSNINYQISFAEIEGLKSDLNIEVSQLVQKTELGANFLVLDLDQYLAAYDYSSKDGYRRNKNNKDMYKIECIKAALLISQ